MYLKAVESGSLRCKWKSLPEDFFVFLVFLVFLTSLQPVHTALARPLCFFVFLNSGPLTKPQGSDFQVMAEKALSKKALPFHRVWYVEKEG